MNDDQKENHTVNPQISAKLDALSNFDRELVQIVLDEPGISYTELSRRLKKYRSIIKDHMESEKVKDVLKDIQISDIQYKIELRYKALKTIENLMNHEDGKVALGAAKAIVDNMEPTQINVNDVTGFKFVLPEPKKDE